MDNTTKLIKQADWINALTDIATGVSQGAAQLGATGAVYLIALTGLAGVGVGYAAAKATAHGNKDIDTIKKEYENERLKADLGYLSAKTKSEYEAFKRRQQPKPARVLG